MTCLRCQISYASLSTFIGREDLLWSKVLLILDDVNRIIMLPGPRMLFNRFDLLLVIFFPLLVGEWTENVKLRGQ